MQYSVYQIIVYESIGTTTVIFSLVKNKQVFESERYVFHMIKYFFNCLFIRIALIPLYFQLSPWFSYFSFFVSRLLYGKMQRWTGAGSSGKSGVGASRSTVLRFLGNCTHEELSIFMDLILAPFKHLCIGKSSSSPFLNVPSAPHRVNIKILQSSLRSFLRDLFAY